MRAEAHVPCLSRLVGRNAEKVYLWRCTQFGGAVYMFNGLESTMFGTTVTNCAASVSLSLRPPARPSSGYNRVSEPCNAFLCRGAQAGGVVFLFFSNTLTVLRTLIANCEAASVRRCQHPDLPLRTALGPG